MNAIELEHVNKSLGGFAIRDLSLTVPSGTICGLVGENGAGKSTTIRMLMGALRPDSGKITVLGTDSFSKEFRQVKEEIGVVLDEAYYPEVLNAVQVGKIMADTFRRWDAGLYQSYLERFTLPGNKPFKEFSRGMKMKLAIAVALSHRPRLLVLDEATSGLDPIVRDEVLEIFNEFTGEEDRSILISSHILSDLEKLCDYVAFLHQGQLLFCDEKDRLLEEYAVFNGTAEQLAELRSEAVVGRESSSYGGVRALVKRSAVPSGLPLEKASVEDIVLFLVKGEKGR